MLYFLIIRKYLKSFFTLFFIISTYFSNQPILPEVIATTTLLKCGGVAAAMAVGGRYVMLATKEISQFYQTRFRNIPQAEFYNDFSSGSEIKDSAVQVSTPNTAPARNLFTKIKYMVFFKKEQQYQSQSCQTDGINGTSWSQTNIHAQQQARGFFPKVNNYHYHSDKGDFWKGATVGSFVTGTTCFYLVVKHK